MPASPKFLIPILAPIFDATDTADRSIIAEKFGINDTDGRALMMADWQEYKLISFQDVSDPTDISTYRMYLLGEDGVKESTLATPPNPGDAHEAAYEALVAKDQSLNPEMSAPPPTINIVLPTSPHRSPIDFGEGRFTGSGRYFSNPEPMFTFLARGLPIPMISSAVFA